ncbi:germination (cortex hydrolysis) and sporulation protein GerM [Halalkalibacter wakoensis JCM 9140]|uniref:Germination (Cortex hydrolysis) and sporulation protein GerM n=1 Tax=Halalkalibacter wakoensis JCM 9140 TaxID=1236970 RepID=W4Q272_9BACI|nr:GerMN domain-containing protein [Halalkalibacter wakoensis]GAE26171.1 germination (cortex hydrolysis) and sporulation protein GerM [Halalkalibacter wakoensis JCM 9140]
MRKVLRKGVPILAFTMLTMAACSSGANEAGNEMDTPPTNYLEEDESLGLEEDTDDVPDEAEGDEENSGDDATSDSVQRELYLIDSNGLVVPQTFELPKTESVLKQSLEYLVDGGPVTELLPNGFQAVLPAGTEVTVNLKSDGMAVADFSNEFKDYNPSQEKQVLEAVTWTLTQFENVDSVQINVNGYKQDTMPVDGTPIGEGVSRANGINLETGSVTDVVNSKAVTLYFLAQHGENTYYVPVTRRVATGTESLTAAVEELLKGPSNESQLITDFRHEVALIDEPLYENGTVTLNFNESLLSQNQGSAVSSEVLNMLALTLTEQEGIEKVAVQVNGEADILSESGNVVEPVSRPTLVNTGAY